MQGEGIVARSFCWRCTSYGDSTDVAKATGLGREGGYPYSFEGCVDSYFFVVDIASPSLPSISKEQQLYLCLRMCARATVCVCVCARPGSFSGSSRHPSPNNSCKRSSSNDGLIRRSINNNRNNQNNRTINRRRISSIRINTISRNINKYKLRLHHQQQQYHGSNHNTSNNDNNIRSINTGRVRVRMVVGVGA